MKNLLEEKKKIIRESLNGIANDNNDFLNRLSNLMKDKKLSTGGEVGGILNSIKAMVKIDSESTLGMDGQQRLETAKLYFQHAEQTRNTVKEVNESLLKVVDEQLALIKEDIKQIDEKLKYVDDEAERERLISERDEMMPTAEPPPKD